MEIIGEESRKTLVLQTSLICHSKPEILFLIIINQKEKTRNEIIVTSHTGNAINAVNNNEAIGTITENETHVVWNVLNKGGGFYKGSMQVCNIQRSS